MRKKYSRNNDKNCKKKITGAMILIRSKTKQKLEKNMKEEGVKIKLRRSNDKTMSKIEGIHHRHSINAAEPEYREDSK